MDHKLADEDQWPLLAGQRLDDEERLLQKTNQQSEPITPVSSRRNGVRRAIVCATKGLVLVGVLVYLFAGVGRSVVEKNFAPPPPSETDLAAVSRISVLTAFALTQSPIFV